jgi:hypothetical protein
MKDRRKGEVTGKKNSFVTSCSASWHRLLRRTFWRMVKTQRYIGILPIQDRELFYDKIYFKDDPERTLFAK